MSSTSRARLHPVAIVSLVIGGLIILGALVFLSVFLTSAQTSPNDQATQKLVQWQEIFEKYRSEHGALPDVPAGGYCLGTGFPVGTGGTANCRDYDAPTYYSETASAPLLEALSSVGALPQGISAAVRGTVGPYAVYDDEAVRLLTAEEQTCEAPAVEVWNDGGGLAICQIALTR